MKTKKVLSMTLVLIVLLIPILACSDSAIPQTRQERILIEGMEETITTTLVKSGKGYSMWIDTEYLVLQPEIEGLGMDIYVSPYNNTGFHCELAVYESGLYDYSLEQAVEDTRQVLQENYGNEDIIENVNFFEGLRAAGLSATDGDNVILYFLMESDSVLFHTVITCPREAEEGFASRVLWMLRSFEVME
ncbi:MAG: hypothetical protein FWF47_05645 [Clostridia bacterium]|nr:hypothetical protein [Clostridia bacterium]